ncbi:hypothetical protein ACF0H5_009298 [Mactra antiquata]
MSDAEPDDEETIENPDPEADATDNVNANLNVEADTGCLNEPNVTCSTDNVHQEGVAACKSIETECIPGSDNATSSNHGEETAGDNDQLDKAINGSISDDPESFQAIGEDTEADSHCNSYQNDRMCVEQSVADESFRNINSNQSGDLEVSHDKSIQNYNELAAEDEQCFHGNACGTGEEECHEAASQPLCKNDEASESQRQVANTDLECHRESNTGERLNPDDLDGLENSTDDFLGPECELEEVQCATNTNNENEPTESDQETDGNINENVTENPIVDSRQNAIEEVTDNNEGNIVEESDDNLHVNERLVPEDEINVVCTVKSESATESYQPECDQSETNITDNVSSQNAESSCHTRSDHSDDMLNYNAESVESNVAENKVSASDKDDVNSVPVVSTVDCDNVNLPVNTTRNKSDDSDTNYEPDHSFKVTDSVTSTSKQNLGAIPKVLSNSVTPSKKSNQSENRLNQSGNRLNQTENRKVDVDSEDELLNELDETLKSSIDEKFSNDQSVSGPCAISNVEQTSDENKLFSCDQCLLNNIQCSFKCNLGNQTRNDNTASVKDLKKQLHHAKQMLLDRECEISRLKDDLTDHRVRCETLTEQRDNTEKELKRLKNHNSDDLYIPQIKELEYTITQQTNEIRSLKDKLSSHDGAAKRAIATLQNEMKLRVEQVTKQCEEARSEKEMMVVKYAQAEQKNLEFKKRAERAETKLKEMEKERDIFLGKMKAVKDQRSKMAADLEAKTVEMTNLHKELDKHRELVSSSDTRVKWAQNKLKAELEAHKDTKSQLDKMNVKLKEAKEETQQIRQDCQAIIKTYQESEEVKSNSLDKELKQKESELLQREVQKNNFELAHVKTQRELEQVKKEFHESQSKLSALTEKLSSVEAEKEQASLTNAKYTDIIQNQKREIQDLQKRIESLVQYKTDFTKAQELIKNLDSEIAELKMANKELVADMESCRRRESDKLELTSKLSRKNAELQSENSTLSNKVLTITGELQAVKMEVQDYETKLKDLSDNLGSEQKLRHYEVQSLNTKLAGKCKAVEDLSRKLEDEKDEIKTLKRKHTNNIKDLTRQLQQARRKLENYEVNTNGDKDTMSMGSRTSSNGSLNTMSISESTVTQVVQPNHNIVQNSVHRHPSPDQEYPVITEQVEVDKQTLIERIVKLQRTLARKNEKIEFTEDHISQLVDEIQKKNKIIQSYILKEEAGTMTTEHRDHAKAEISRKHSIMGSVYSSHSNDGTMTLDLSLEINRKVQAVLEDTLLKNMMLKENLDTLGTEIARLSQENRRLQLQLQGGKSKSRSAQSSR